jgi:oligopeptidase B
MILEFKMSEDINMIPSIERKSQYYSIGKINDPSNANYMETKSFEDSYFWLRDESRSNPEILDYLKDENVYFENFLKGTEDEQNKIVELLKSYMKEDDTSFPIPGGKGQFESNYYYYTKTYKGKGYPEVWRKNKLTNVDTCILDCNELAEGKSYCDLTDVKFSYDNKYMYYGVNFNGDEWYDITIYDLEENKLVEHNLPRVKSAVVMVRYSNNIYYVGSEEKTERPYQIWRYDFTTRENRLIYQEDDVERNVQVVNDCLDHQNIYVYSCSFINNECYYIPLDETGNEVAEMSMLLSKDANIKADMYLWRDSWIIVSNKDDVKSHKLFIVSRDDPRVENWTKVDCQTKLPETFLSKSDETVNTSNSLDVLSVECSNDWICVYVKLEDITLTYLISCVDGKLRDQWVLLNNMNNDLETISVACSYYNSNKVWLSISSPLKPKTLYQVDNILNLIHENEKVMEEHLMEEHLKEEHLMHLHTQETPNYDSDAYVFKRLYIESHDGEYVPVSVSYRKDVKDDAPVFLYGYGAYGLTIPAQKLYNSRIWEDLGFIKVIVSVRGEAMRGEKWYLDGKMSNKMNSFKDFISVSEYFKNFEGKTRKLLAEGGSAGGLLMGGVYTMRPDLYDGVIADVPFMDVIATMSDASLPLVCGEWNEWGNPNISKDYDVMIQYSPYDNLKENVDYPPILITSGLYDPRVQYWEPTKFMAKLRYCGLDKKNYKYFLKTNMDKGHFSNTDRYEELKETAQEIIFGLWVMDLLKK